MSDFKVSSYSSVATFFSASATVLNTFAKDQKSVASRLLAGAVIEAMRMGPAASGEKVVETALARIKADALEATSLKTYRSNLTTAIRYLRSIKGIPAIDGGASETVILAKAQGVIDVYTLRGLVKADQEAKAPKVQARKDASEKAKVEAAQAAHEAQQSARAEYKVAEDCTLDVLALVNAVNAFMAAADGGNDDAARVLDMLHVKLEERRAANAIPLQIAA